MTTLIIGHDGLDAQLCRRFGLDFTRTGHFHNYRSFYMNTVPSWVAIYTGLKRPEWTGPVGGWRWWFHHGRQIDENPNVFTDLNGRGLSVGIMGMPLTYPPPQVRGWVISGFPSPLYRGETDRPCWHPLWFEKFMGDYPGDFINVIDEAFVEGKKRMDRAVHNRFWSSDPLTKLRKYCADRLLCLSRIWAEYPVDVLFVGFSFVDHAAHLGVPLGPLYHKANQSINGVMKLIKPEKSLIVSDHGGDIVEKRYDHTPFGVLWTSEEADDETKCEWQVKDLILKMASPSF